MPAPREKVKIQSWITEVFPEKETASLKIVLASQMHQSKDEDAPPTTESEFLQSQGWAVTHMRYHPKTGYMQHVLQQTDKKTGQAPAPRFAGAIVTQRVVETDDGSERATGKPIVEKRGDEEKEGE